MIISCKCKNKSCVFFTQFCWNCVFLWQTMLRGGLTAHALLLIKLCSSAVVRYQGTGRAVHTCWSECDEYALTFHHWLMCLWLPLVSHPTGTLWFPNLTCSQYLQGSFFFYFNKPLLKHTKPHTLTRINADSFSHAYRSAYSEARTLSPVNTYTQSHIMSTYMLLPFSSTVLSQLQCITFSFSQSFCIYFHQSSMGHFLFCMAHPNFYLNSLNTGLTEQGFTFLFFP